jgi:uncharacterized membrane protein YqjE
MSLTGIFKAIFNAIFASVAGPLIARIRTEWAIAKVELQVKLRELRTGAIMLGVALFFAFFTIALFLTAATLGLAEIMPGWAAALVVGGALLVWVLVFGIWGMVKINKNKDLVPHRAIEAVKDSMP